MCRPMSIPHALLAATNRVSWIYVNIVRVAYKGLNSLIPPAARYTQLLAYDLDAPYVD